VDWAGPRAGLPANELDVARHASLPPGPTGQTRTLIEGLAPHALGMSECRACGPNQPSVAIQIRHT
jgi:hypothetical protein